MCEDEEGVSSSGGKSELTRMRTATQKTVSFAMHKFIFMSSWPDVEHTKRN